ncbi:MAG: hypothetical protein KDN20_00715 [Verrucomicrobiae bacterium]|nr:hypothetical protein [Verrucomicrobiae bacterium]
MSSHSQLPASGSSAFPGYPTLDLTGLFHTLTRRIWWVAGIFAAFVTLAIIYVTFIATKKYESIAVVYIEREQVLNDNIQSVHGEDFSKLDALKSLERSLVSASVILRVVDKLDLRNDPTFLKPKSSGKPYSDAEIIELVSKNVKATLERGTRLVIVEVTDKSPSRAKLMAEAFVSEFEINMMEQNLAAAQKATAMLQAQAEKQLEKVSQAEDALQNFRESHPEVALEQGGVTETELEDLNKLVSEAKNTRLKLEAEVMKLDSIDPSNPEAILEVGDFMDQEHITKLLLARGAKRAEMVKIERQYEPSHPTYQAHLADLEGLEMEVAKVAQSVGETIRKSLDTAIEHEKQLISSVSEQKRNVLSVDRVRKEFRALQQQVGAATDTYYALLARINETDVTEGVKESIIRMEQAPFEASKPSSPKKKVVVGLAGALGLFFGFGVVIAIYLLDRSLRTRQQVEQTLGLPVLAEISHAPEASSELRDSLVVFSEPHSLAAESFRALRTSLSTLSPRSVLITSGMPDEGKSFCALNLALLQAQLGYRTLLVDADFRRPSLSKALMYRAADPKASEGALEMKNSCQRTPFPNLYLIACAQFAPNNGETMNGEHFAAMLWEAYRSFDCVIIDSSPLGMVSDTLNFARYADAVALVVRSGVTQTGSAQQACRQLRQMRVPLAGCILNGVIDEGKAKAYFETYRPTSHQGPRLALSLNEPS